MIKRFEDDYPKDTIYYRYDIVFITREFSKPPALTLVMRKFVVMKSDDDYVWVNERLNRWNVSSKSRRIKRSAKAKFAHPTKLAAIKSARIRLKLCLQEGETYVNECKQALSLARDEKRKLIQFKKGVK